MRGRDARAKHAREKRATGIEPASPAWEAGVITIIRRSHGSASHQRRLADLNRQDSTECSARSRVSEDGGPVVPVARRDVVGAGNPDKGCADVGTVPSATVKTSVPVAVSLYLARSAGFRETMKKTTVGTPRIGGKPGDPPMAGHRCEALRASILRARFLNVLLEKTSVASMTSAVPATTRRSTKSDRARFTRASLLLRDGLRYQRLGRQTSIFMRVP